MTIYLDDNALDKALVQLLRRAGHDVVLPADVGLAGREDPVHLRQAIRLGRVLLTQNYRDFQLLHELVLEAQGHHPGILVIRRDNNPKKDLDPQGTVRAIAKLEAAGVPVADGYLILNHWR